MFQAFEFVASSPSPLPPSLVVLRHEGDNQVSARRLPCLADRVSLGLLPSADAGIPLAVYVLRERGGCMHVHGNCIDTQQGIR